MGSRGLWARVGLILGENHLPSESDRGQMLLAPQLPTTGLFLALPVTTPVQEVSLCDVGAPDPPSSRLDSAQGCPTRYSGRGVKLHPLPPNPAALGDDSSGFCGREHVHKILATIVGCPQSHVS